MARRAQLLEIDARHPDPRRLSQAADKLHAQEIVVYPTDTIYGLAADFESRSAMERLYKVRDLERTKPLSLVVGSVSEASKYAFISDDCYRVMRRVLPGPFTFILPAKSTVPRAMGNRKRRTVGIRMPEHPVALGLVEALGRPIFTTSALQPDADDSEVSDPIHLAESYADRQVALVLDAGILKGSPSTIVDWTGDNPEITRAGAGDPDLIAE